MPHNTLTRRRVHRSNQEKERAVSRSSGVKPSPQRSIRLFIADSYEVHRVGMRALLEEEPDMTVVGETDTAEDVLAESRRTKPDVMLLTYGLFKRRDTELRKQLSDALPALRIVVIVWSNDDDVFRHAVENGAQAILVGDICREKLIQAVHTVARGGSYLDQSGTDQTFRLLRQHSDALGSRSVLCNLSAQERKIISHIANGDTNKEIATKMTLSEKTVKNYIANMFVKLEITRRTQAVTLYLQTCRSHSPGGEWMCA